MKGNERTIYLSVGLLIGLIVGLFFDFYQVNVYGAVGLGIVFTPMIGLFLGLTVSKRL